MTRPDLPPGCPERTDPAFYRYIPLSRGRARRRIRVVIAAHPHLAAHHLTSPRAVRAYLAAIPTAYGRACPKAAQDSA